MLWKLSISKTVICAVRRFGLMPLIRALILLIFDVRGATTTRGLTSWDKGARCSFEYTVEVEK